MTPHDRLAGLLLENVDEKLRPPRRVHAILDGARDEGILPLVRECPGEWSCLWRGPLAPELEEVAPYLCELVPGAAWTGELLASGWGRSWGVFVEAACDRERLERHLRSFLKVRDERQRTLLFRWYDPRVLRVYLPTCNASEAGALAGPVTRFFCEGEDATVLLEWSRGPEGFLRRDRLLDEEAGRRAG